MTPEQENQLRKNIQQHKWASLEDWVRSLDDLADLSDNDLEQIANSNQNREPIYFD